MVRRMALTLVIAEKPSVGRDVARVLPGPFQKHEGYLEGPEHVITWAVGHLVQLAEPDEYDAKFKKWRMADLPIVPDDFRLVVRDERSRKQMTVITKLLGRDDVDLVINACDAGREGELIFAWTLEKSGVKKPVRRLWLSSMTSDTSSRLSMRVMTVICLRERSSRTTSLKRSGTIGRSAMRHFLYLASYSSGSASCTRWPTAHVTTWVSDSRYPSCLANAPGSALVRSRPTDGFSAMTSVFPIRGVRVARGWITPYRDQSRRPQRRERA